MGYTGGGGEWGISIMDNELLGNGNTETGTEKRLGKKQKSKIKIEGTEDSTVSRVVISKEADDALKALLAKARDGFDGGEIERGDVVSWLLVNHEKLVSDADIKAIRSLHFDEVLALTRLAKVATQSGELSDELKAQIKSLLSNTSKKAKE